MDEFALTDIKAHMADLATPIGFEKHCIAGLQRIARDGRGGRAVHRRRGAWDLDIRFGLEQIDQETAAIEPLLHRGAAELVGRAQQFMGTVNHVVDSCRSEGRARL